MANINSSDWLTAIGQSKFTRFFSLWTMVTLEEQMEDLDAGLRRKSCHQKIGDNKLVTKLKWFKLNPFMKSDPFSNGRFIRWHHHVITFGDSFGDINYSFWRVKRRIRFFWRMAFWLARFNTGCIRVTHLISLKISFREGKVGVNWSQGEKRVKLGRGWGKVRVKWGWIQGDERVKRG